MNKRFVDTLAGINGKIPPVWMMRQAGRYHTHYQNLRAKHSFMELCKNPELAAQVAMGPIQDFDFDVAILFSDLLFPLEALGMGLEYTDAGPRLAWQLRPENINQLVPATEALEKLFFQKKAVELTRQMLPKDKSLVGFVGGTWTLFVYACEGSHTGGMILSKKQLPLFQKYLSFMLPLLKENIRLQLEGGAEIVYLFDTAAGELSPAMFQEWIEPGLLTLAEAYPKKLAYYSKATYPTHFSKKFLSSPWAGLGFDHKVGLPDLLKNKPNKGFLQGNFDQNLLHAETDFFKSEFSKFLKTFSEVDVAQRGSWVCGLGHGVLPKTPEHHVRFFVDEVRKVLG